MSEFNTETIAEITEKLRAASENSTKLYDAGVEFGSTSEYDLFWDTFQNNGSRGAYDFAFAEASSGTLWQVGTTYRPKYPIKPTAAMNMYYATRLPYEALKEVDFSQCTNFYSTFAYAATPHLGVIDARRATRMNLAFAHTNTLTAIDKFIVAETTPFVNAFVGCKNLTNIVVEGTIAQNGLDMSSCTKLSQGSIETIIWCLSDTTQGLKITLSKAAVDKAYETSEGANDGSDSSIWFDDKLGYRPNWTIALV